MRKRLALSSLAAAGVAAVAATPAVAQEPGYTFKSEFRMTPTEAGTRSAPRGSTLDGRFDFGSVFESEVPVITGGRVLLPRGIVYNGGSYPKCSGATLRDRPGDCPNRSIMGRSRDSAAHVDPDGSAVRAIFLNGGARRIWAYVTLFNPAFVQEPVPINVERLHSARWGYELTFETPEELQSIVGVPTRVSIFRFTIGGKPYARDYLATNGGCPKRGFRPYEVSLDYRFHPNGPAGTSVDRGRLACN